MSEDNKRGLHIHLGGLVIIILIALLFFSADFRSITNSPRVKENVSYIKERSKNIWNKYLSEPINSKFNNHFNNLVDRGAEKIKSKGSFFNLPSIDDEQFLE